MILQCSFCPQFKTFVISDISAILSPFSYFPAIWFLCCQSFLNFLLFFLSPLLPSCSLLVSIFLHPLAQFLLLYPHFHFTLLSSSPWSSSFLFLFLILKPPYPPKIFSPTPLSFIPKILVLFPSMLLVYLFPKTIFLPPLISIFGFSSPSKVRCSDLFFF